MTWNSIYCSDRSNLAVEIHFLEFLWIQSNKSEFWIFFFVYRCISINTVVLYLTPTFQCTVPKHGDPIADPFINRLINWLTNHFAIWLAAWLTRSWQRSCSLYQPSLVSRRKIAWQLPRVQTERMQYHGNCTSSLKQWHQITFCLEPATNSCFHDQ